MQTLLIWLILVESAIKNGISSNDQDVWQKTHLCWNLQCDPFLHYPSCLSLVENTHFCSIPILLALQTATYLEIQLTNSNWVEPLSLAQLCPSLFSNLHVKLESFTKFSQNFISCYGLLSTEVINNPVLTGSRVCLPFYSGCRYAAFPARNDQEVKNWHLLHGK